MSAAVEAKQERQPDVVTLQDVIEALPADQLWNGKDFTRHYFADGAYARELTIPAGVVVVGKIHKTAHICIVSKGVVDVLDERGNRTRITAPATFVSPPGTKRAAYAIEDTVWTVFHPTNETDLARIEAAFIAPDFDALASNPTDAIAKPREA